MTRVEALEAEVVSLRAALAATTASEPTAAAEPAPAQSSPDQTAVMTPSPAMTSGQVSADPTASDRLMNPAISVIGNFLGAAGENLVAPSPSLEMAESEVTFSAAIDTYARADVFLSFSQQEVSVEEAYVTFPAVPGGLLVKAGQQRAQFGKVNTMHRHVLPWVDRPLVTQHLLGGEDGLSDAGVTVSRLLPAPGNVFLEATGTVFRGESEGIFVAQQRGHLATVAHLRAYGDLTEASNLDLGASYARGHNGLGNSLLSHLYGVDATFRWKPLRRAIYQSFVGRGELIWNRRATPFGLQKALGYYLSAEYQPLRRWSVGTRFDQSDRIDMQGQDSGASALVTFRPSEFSQLRAQYRFTDYAEDVRANELLLQLQFAIGAHGAHPF